jgi:cellulose synthase operon protein C
MISTSKLLLIARALLLFAVVALVSGCSSPEQKAQNYYDRGMKLLAQQDYVKAGIEFKNALQLKKDLVGAWRGLAEIELHNRNLQGAVPILKTIVELDPKDLDARLKLGHFLMMGNALDQALEQANASFELDAHNPNVLAFRAAVLLRLQDRAGAIREAKAALDIDPNNAEAIIVLAGERMYRDDNEGALSILDRPGLTLSKGDEFAFQLLKLQIFNKMGDLKQLEALLRKLHETYPGDPAYTKALINLYIKQKRFDDAEKELRVIADADRSNVEAGLNVVRFLVQAKGAAAARQELVDRISAGTQAFKYQLALAEFDFAQGKATDSAQALENLAKNASSPEDKVAAQVKLAYVELSQKKFDSADALVSKILTADNRNIDGLKLRAAIRLQQGQLDAAISDLRRALDDQPRSFDLMLLLANAYERGGSIELAEKEYADAAKISNFDVATTINYVTFLRRRGNNERAEDVLTELSRRWPNNIAVLTSLAEVRLDRQNWAGAEEIAAAIQRMGDGRALGEQIQAAALSGEGKYSDSAKILEGLASAAPGAVQPMAGLVNALVKAQKLDEAVNFLQTALKANPANAEALVLLGSVQLIKNEPDQAVQSFQTAIERQPKNVAGYQALANFYIRGKKLSEAEKTIRSGLQEQPDSPVLHLALAAILEFKGDYEAAIAEYEGLLKKDPSSMIVANNLASLLSEYHTDKDSIDRAYSLAQILRKSQVPSFKETLGWLDYLRGDYASATGLLEQAVAGLPNRPLIHYHLGMSYVGGGQTGKAAEQFKKALELGPDSALEQKIRAAQEKAEKTSKTN